MKTLPMTTFAGIALAALVAAVLAAPLQARELVLVENGVSLAPVVVFEDAPPFTRQAADELAEYIEKTSGARPEVVEGRPDPLPESAIWVGYQPVLDELFPDLDFDLQHPEEILIAANERHLVIAGRDVWDPDHLVVEGRNWTIEGKQREYGTANAVYTFLQDFLDVRWLWPGELGVDIAERETIAFAPFEHRYHPQMTVRSGIFRFSDLGDARGLSHDWVRFQRLQLDSMVVPVGGHAFTAWWERFSETHPEYFALQPDGTRSGFPGPRTVKLCDSNPAVWRQWIADVEEQARRDPNRTVFNAAPNDSWHRGHCVCEHCVAWDHPDGEMRRFVWEGVSQDYVALSDRHATYLNNLARLLRERFPDGDYYVRGGAYGHTRPAPIEASLDDNIVFTAVANFLLRPGLADRGSPRGTTHREQLAGWGKVAKRLVWRPNTGSPAGWQQGQPDVPLTQTMDDIRFVAEHNCVGIMVDTVWEHWSTQGPLYYVMGKLAWDPYQDGEALLKDYYQRGFGPAAEEVEAYWSLMENAREDYYRGDRAYPEVYDDALFDRAYGLLDAAARKAEGAPEKYAKRIEFVRVGLDYTRLIIENRRLMALVREGQDEDGSAAERVRANWLEFERMSEEQPLALRYNSLRPRAGNRRTRSLHPDYFDQ